VIRQPPAAYLSEARFGSRKVGLHGALRKALKSFSALVWGARISHLRPALLHWAVAALCFRM